ncbi:Mu transposase domain-containing protein [Streptomyces sp. P1-3]|uniref:Mu transposase domain-containing protein n=1 Tax=Streptomyces sp. P1-3 TaxID=3421658 RepID=UPI003D36022D
MKYWISNLPGDIPARDLTRLAKARWSRSRPAGCPPLRGDRHSQIAVRTNRYQVPVRLIGERGRGACDASHLVVYNQNVKVARHERPIAKGGCRLELDHYVEVFRKPGAFPGATALEQARSRCCRWVGASPASTRKRTDQPLQRLAGNR